MVTLHWGCMKYKTNIIFRKNHTIPHKSCLGPQFNFQTRYLLQSIVGVGTLLHCNFILPKLTPTRLCVNRQVIFCDVTASPFSNTNIIPNFGHLHCHTTWYFCSKSFDVSSVFTLFYPWMSFKVFKEGINFSWEV